MTDFTPFNSPSKPKSSRTASLPRSQAVTSFQQTVLDMSTPDHIDEEPEMSSISRTPSHASTSLKENSELMSDSPLSNNDASPWIGGTGLGSAGLGKSGKVIERLMAECDRLKRDLRSEVAKREELQRSASTHKERLEALRAENDRLSNAKTMDDNMIKRRDRKIEELKAEIVIERQKRDSLESRAQEAEKKQEDMQHQSNEQLQRYLEEAKQASISATIYQTSHKQLREEYQQRIATSQKSLKDLHDKREDDRRERDKDRKKMVKIDVVNQQMAQELEKTRRAHNELIAISEQDRDEKAAVVERLAAEMNELRKKDRRREIEYEQKVAEVQDTMNQMKWVMSIKKFTDENGLHSPPPSPPG